MCFSGSLEALAPALAKAQGELEDATKSSVNPAFKSKYADLAEVLQTIRPVLSKHGLALVQTVGAFSREQSTVQVTTMLLHSSGQYIQDTVYMPVGKPDAQGVGSATTYARRYGAAAIVGIAQDDDDGNAASGKAKASPAKAEPSASTSSGSAEDKLIAKLNAATKPEEVTATAASFAALSPDAQKRVLPIVKAAQERTKVKNGD